MLEFNVVLTEQDVRKFVKHRLKSFRNFVTYIVYSVVAFFVIIFGLISGLYLFIFLVLALFIVAFQYRKHLIFRKVLFKNFDVIGKNRRFFVDSRFLNVLCEKDEGFNGRYSLYELSDFELTKSYIYLTFNRNIFFIIPTRFLKDGEFLEFCEILKERTNK